VSSLEKLSINISNFFESNPELKMERFADFGSEVINTISITNILNEVLENPTLLDEVSRESYEVSSNFLKLLLHRDKTTGWGLRVHVFTPEAGQRLDEPWHEHRWDLVSSVLAGAIHSENAFAEIKSSDQSDDTPEDNQEMYYYSIPDKRIVGSIQPKLLGKCALQNVFSLSVREGQTYAHQSALAHHLTLLPEDGITITSVITAPPNRTQAAFIEYEPLNFKERERPKPLGKQATIASIQSTINEISKPKASKDLQESPQPDYLYLTKS
jgi:hypothetical protein